MTAQQYGHLASMRHSTGAVHELGDQMAVTNSRINKALASADPELANAELMLPAERSTLDDLARHANENEFGASVAQRVGESYPPAIAALESVEQMPAVSEALASSIPELKRQLADAHTIPQTASGLQAWQPSETGSTGAPPSKLKSD